MKTVTIPDPQEVGEWLDREIPEAQDGNHLASYDKDGWMAMHWMGRDDGFVSGRGATPEELLADLRQKVAAADPLARLRKQAKKLGHELIEINPVRS